jgi:membrane-bound inhibitor of C-type lysozyme
LSHTWFILTALSFLFVTIVDSGARAGANDTFVTETTVYDCVARERPFSIVTRTAPDGLTIFIPEPFVSRTLLLDKVEAASGVRYEKEGITAWLKGDGATFIIDTVSVPLVTNRDGFWKFVNVGG